MKLMNVWAQPAADKPGVFQVQTTYEVEAGSLMKAISAALRTDGAPIATDPGPAAAQPSAEPAPATAEAPARRTRRSSAEVAAEKEATAAAPVEASARRRRASPEAAPAAPQITDPDLVRAASEGAAAICKEMNDDSGPGIILAILEDLGVKSVDQLAPDQRQKFLDEIAEEVKLAKAQAATGG